MTYKKLYEDALFKLEHNKITLGEFEEMIKPLEREVEPTSFQWCTDCKEYDQEKHCCHRWSKVIRNTVEEMKQEPILDKVRAEIEQTSETVDGFLMHDGTKRTVLQILNKYREVEE